jgi:putative transposase
MSRVPLLTEAQMRRIEPFFPISRELRRVDDRRVIRGIVYVIRNGLQKDAPRGYGPHKTLYNHFVRWSRLGVFDRVFKAPVAQAGVPERLMIDSTHLRAHRTTASFAKKRMLHAASDAPAAG